MVTSPDSKEGEEAPGLAAKSAPLKVVLVGSRDDEGGAGRALARIFYMLERYGPERGVDVTLRVIHQSIDHPKVVGGKPTRSRREYARYYFRTRFRKRFPRRPFVSSNTLLHSQAIHHSGLGRELNAMDVDVVVLNWLGNFTLSIEEIGRLKKPIVWHLHDMWMFSGAEHVTRIPRAQVGYRRSSRPADESGPDIDRETFRRKRRHWKRPSPVITPSNWLGAQVAKSALTAHWPVAVIPLPLDTDFWHPVPGNQLRRAWGADDHTRVVFFAAGGGTQFPHKGADLFFASLEYLQVLTSSMSPRILVVIAGEEGQSHTLSGFDIVYAGALDDDGMREAYGAADVLVVPSRVESWGQVASEAQACGLPAVVFDGSGLVDVVEHQRTGYYAAQDDPQALAQGIAWVLENDERRLSLCEAARARAVTMWHPSVVAQQYIEVLRRAC